MRAAREGVRASPSHGFWLADGQLAGSLTSTLLEVLACERMLPDLPVGTSDE
jgi:hypothetical protein